jgi:hypothetical protein
VKQVFEFTVTVEVDIDIPDDDEYDRRAKDYAEAALNAVSLPDASRLDGFADLTGEAWLDDVMPEDAS